MAKNMLAEAIAIASEAHRRQTDKGGKAYILHPIRLMMRLRTEDEELMCVAILHDVVEDTDWTLDQLHEAGFSARVINALRCLDHPDYEPYEEYIERVGTNIDAIRVKKEDLRDNSDITRLKGISDKDLLRTRKYHRAYMRLLELQKQHDNAE